MMKTYWERKKVIVTGAAGFIGSHVVDELVRKKASVTAIVSHRSDQAKIEHNLSQVLNDIKITPCNLLDLQETVRIINGSEVVLHFAAVDGGINYKHKYPASIFYDNSQMIFNILESCRLNSIKKLLLMSSINIYSKKMTGKVKEEDYAEGISFNELDGYSWGKRFLEVAARLYYQQYNLQIAIPRVGNIYGPRDYHREERMRVVPMFINNALHNKSIHILGDAGQERAFLYVTDLARGLLAMTEKYACADPINIAGFQNISLKELAEQIILLTNSRSTIEIIGKKNTVLQNAEIDIKKAKKLIGFNEAISYREGLELTVNYYKKMQGL